MICRAVRQWESARGAAEGQTWVAERHMETCDECQAFFAEDDSFEEMMRGAARVETRTDLADGPDEGFEQRILRAVRESQPEREVAGESRAGRVKSFGFSLAAVAAGVTLALVLVDRQVTPESSGPVVTLGEGQTAGSAETLEAAAWWKSGKARSSALELVRSNPLEQEIESISTDARSVIGFLALNFLPSVEAEKARVEAVDDRG
ncbi:hypothetical protein CMV30_09435 [Nibricoccus aquaticus]|uniref:Zinc-finger domain-containing protein n=1 Tax=Nibricoccus aquaticus TaxID=2576891 RepID=A0A290Q662_9BACT|nr:hypothetical protein CMV30_09435 [Nibricoccus aquaticus]